MALRENDLVNTVIKQISLDEFVPKTGEEKDVAVLGFHVVQSYPGQDLYNFISSSVIENRDVELSPNPNTDGYYMLFVEFDRNEQLLDNIKSIVEEINNVTGKLDWKVNLPYADEAIDLDDPMLADYVQTDPSNYMSATEFKEHMAQKARDEEDRLQHEEAESNSNKILEFLRDSNFLQAGFSDSGKLTVMGRAGNAQFEVIGFGEATETLTNAGINESAIAPLDYDTKQLNSMLGSLKAIKIDEYVVIFNTNTKQALVGKPC